MMNGQGSRELAILSAVRFAAEKHRDQRRKDHESSPYINHPIQVAETLARVGNVSDLATLQAALLHDTIEDTETTPEELEQAFGAEVRDLVLEVTDDTSLPRQARKQLQVEHAQHLSAAAKLVKLADKICNVNDILKAPHGDWSVDRKVEYLSWSERVIQGCRGINANLDDRYDQVLARAHQAFSEKS